MPSICMDTNSAASPTCLCVAIQNDKASEKTLEVVVTEISTWHSGNIFTEKLHLVHVTLLPPDNELDADEARSKARQFMRERFLPILDKLPDSCDWELHVLTVTQPVIEGDPNRKSHSTKSKKLVAAALCREAEKQKATELIVNKHDKKDHGLDDRLSDRVIKYSTIPVRIISTSGQEQHLGKGREAKVLEDPLSTPPTGDRTGAKTTPTPRTAAASPQYPADKTDVVSHAKRIAKGFKNLMSRRSGARLSEQGSSDFSSATKSSEDSGANAKQGT